MQFGYEKRPENGNPERVQYSTGRTWPACHLQKRGSGRRSTWAACRDLKLETVNGKKSFRLFSSSIQLPPLRLLYLTSTFQLLTSSLLPASSFELPALFSFHFSLFTFHFPSAYPVTSVFLLRVAFTSRHAHRPNTMKPKSTFQTISCMRSNSSGR